MTADLASPATEQGKPWELSARDEAATEELGRALGHALAEGGVVALIGPLGAGKTRLVQSIAAALGVDRREVNSPTFVLIQEYAAARQSSADRPTAVLPIFHCDTYRLRSLDEFLDLGVDEMFQAGGISLIEWADRVSPLLPADRLEVEIAVTGPTSRHFRIAAGGPHSAELLAKARAGFRQPA
jgi:tRNA threonylcarbamoyladenosine biosynthesis protein TsaE